MGIAPIEHIRISQQGKDQLMRLKRATGIKNWNVLCRWAFCTSIADPSTPEMVMSPESSVEMTWKVFGGELHEVYASLLKYRCFADGLGISHDVLVAQFKRHLHRGIFILSSDRSIKNIGGLTERLALKRA